MRLALDTNAYTAFCKGDRQTLRAIQSAEALLIPLPVLAELRAGFAVGRKGDQNEATHHATGRPQNACFDRLACRASE